MLSLPLFVEAPNSTLLGHVCFEFCYKQGVMAMKLRSVASSSHSSKESPGDTAAFGDADHSLHGLGSGHWGFAIVPVKDSCMFLPFFHMPCVFLIGKTNVYTLR